LLFGAEFIDRHHHQRRLHAHHRAIAGIDPLDFARDQPVADVIQAGAAVLLGNRRPQQAEFAHFTENRRIGGLVAERFQHARQQFVLAVGVGGIAHHALVVAQLLVQQKRIVPMEACFLVHFVLL